MAGDYQQVTFGTGASGLTPASITYGGIDTRPLMTAIQQRMLNQQRAQELQLNIQKLSQDANLREQQFGLEREKMHADDDLRAAQMENYYAMADYHRAAAKQTASGMKSKWQYEAQFVPQIADWENEVRSIPAP